MVGRLSSPAGARTRPSGVSMPSSSSSRMARAVERWRPLVRGPDLERGDDLDLALHPGRGHRSCRAAFGAPRRFRSCQLAQRAIDRSDRHAVCRSRACDHLGADRIARRQQRQAPAQVDQCLAQGALRAVSHARHRRRRPACRRGDREWRPTSSCAWQRRAPAACPLSSGHAPR